MCETPELLFVCGPDRRRLHAALDAAYDVSDAACLVSAS
jgi:hypothetical protein